MTFINYAAREINCKIVYYGPGLCGKTTNLQWIYDKTNQQAKGKLILKGVDGVCFIADSQDARMEANAESLQNLEKNLKEQGYDLRTIPYVLQMNKRDLPTAVAPEEMYRQLNMKGEPTFEAVAMNGTGVFDTLKAVAKLVLTELKKK